MDALVTLRFRLKNLWGWRLFSVPSLRFVLTLAVTKWLKAIYWVPGLEWVSFIVPYMDLTEWDHTTLAFLMKVWEKCKTPLNVRIRGDTHNNEMFCMWKHRNNTNVELRILTKPMWSRSHIPQIPVRTAWNQCEMLQDQIGRYFSMGHWRPVIPEVETNGNTGSRKWRLKADQQKAVTLNKASLQDTKKILILLSRATI